MIKKLPDNIGTVNYTWFNGKQTSGKFKVREGDYIIYKNGQN